MGLWKRGSIFRDSSQSIGSPSRSSLPVEHSIPPPDARAGSPAKKRSGRICFGGTILQKAVKKKPWATNGVVANPSGNQAGCGLQNRLFALKRRFLGPQISQRCIPVSRLRFTRTNEKLPDLLCHVFSAKTLPSTESSRPRERSVDRRFSCRWTADAGCFPGIRSTHTDLLRRFFRSALARHHP